METKETMPYICGSCEHVGTNPHQKEPMKGFEIFYYCEKCGNEVMPFACSQCGEDSNEKCHVCGVPLCTSCIDENTARTYPDNLPYCPSHYPDENADHYPACGINAGKACNCDRTANA